MNILYLHSHDTGRFIQPYGYGTATPNLQKLAEQGTLFRQAFCAGPTCSPSRAALLTGLAPHCNGMFGLLHRGFSLHDLTQHLAHYLGTQGYATARVGVEHVTRRDDGVFQEVLDTSHHDAGALARSAVEYLRRPHDKPFFLSAGFFETHREFPDAGLADDARYAVPPPCLPDTPQVRRDMAEFHTMARTMDSGIGQILGTLEAAGLADNTLVISTTDHGIAFPRMKCSLQDSGIGVSLILRGPRQGRGAVFNGGNVVDSMVSQIDLFPTLCDLAEIPHPGWLQGRSLLPLLDGSLDPQQPDALHDAVFSEVTYHAAYEPQRCIRTPRWKYIRRFNDRASLVKPNCDDGHSRRYWLEQGWQDQPYPQEMLFDLVFDPTETNNLIDDPHHAETAQSLRGRLQAWMRQTHDPLLEGQIPPPKGAITNDPDQNLPTDPKTTH